MRSINKIIDHRDIDDPYRRYRPVTAALSQPIRQENFLFRQKHTKAETVPYEFC